jgi:hypothetical protein
MSTSRTPCRATDGLFLGLAQSGLVRNLSRQRPRERPGLAPTGVERTHSAGCRYLRVESGTCDENHALQRWSIGCRWCKIRRSFARSLRHRRRLGPDCGRLAKATRADPPRPAGARRERHARCASNVPEGRRLTPDGQYRCRATGRRGGSTGRPSRRQPTVHGVTRLSQGSIMPACAAVLT